MQSVFSSWLEGQGVMRWMAVANPKEGRRGGSALLCKILVWIDQVNLTAWNFTYLRDWASNTNLLTYLPTYVIGGLQTGRSRVVTDEGDSRLWVRVTRRGKGAQAQLPVYHVTPRVWICYNDVKCLLADLFLFFRIHFWEKERVCVCVLFKINLRVWQLVCVWTIRAPLSLWLQRSYCLFTWFY